MIYLPSAFAGGIFLSIPEVVEKQKNPTHHTQESLEYGGLG